MTANYAWDSQVDKLRGTWTHLSLQSHIQSCYRFERATKDATTFNVSKHSLSQLPSPHNARPGRTCPCSLPAGAGESRWRQVHQCQHPHCPQGPPVSQAQLTPPHLTSAHLTHPRSHPPHTANELFNQAADIAPIAAV